MPKSVIDGFGRTDSDLEPFDPSPDISQNIQQTFDRLNIWDNVNHIWRKAAADIDGRLIISMSGISLNIAVNSAVSCGAAATLLLASKSTRRKFVLMNNGAFLVYIGFSNAVSAVNGFPLSSGAIWIEEQYNGDIWGISPSGANNMRFMDF